MHSRWFIQIYFLPSPPPPFAWSFLLVYCSLLMFLIYFLKHFKHTLLGLVISFLKILIDIIMPFAIFLISFFKVWIISSALAYLCRVHATWLECEKIWPCFCQAPRVSPPLGHFIWILDLCFQGLVANLNLYSVPVWEPACGYEFSSQSSGQQGFLTFTLC